MSHTSLTYHVIFGTYRRMPVINIAHEKELYKYIFDFSVARGVKVRRIGGMPDHIHILCDLPSNLAPADYIKLVKSESSKFMRVNSHFQDWVRWARGYAAFTVDASLREVRRQYIMGQKKHHITTSFLDEYKALLKDAGIELEAGALDEEFN